MERSTLAKINKLGSNFNSIDEATARAALPRYGIDLNKFKDEITAIG